MKKNAYILILMLLAACSSSSDYKAIEDIKDGMWMEKDAQTFSFKVENTNQVYDLYCYVRNATQYPFSNLYLNQIMTLPDGKKAVEVRYNLQLFDETTGQPFGKGLGDLWDHKIIVAKNIKFSQVGNYKITLKQNMRQDPLPYLLAVGFMLEMKK